jgi:hypothetical protein
MKRWNCYGEFFFEKLIVNLASEELPYLISNLKINYCMHTSLPLVPVLGQMNPLHIIHVVL